MFKAIVLLAVVTLVVPMRAFADSSIDLFNTSSGLVFSSTLLQALDTNGNPIFGSDIGTVTVTTDSMTDENLVTNNSIFGPGTLTITSNGSDPSLGGTLFSGTFDFGGWLNLGSLSPDQNQCLLALQFSDGQNLGFLAAVNLTGGNDGDDDDKVVVPEPGTLVLFGTGLVGVAGAVRRKLKIG